MSERPLEKQLVDFSSWKRNRMKSHETTRQPRSSAPLPSPPHPGPPSFQNFLPSPPLRIYKEKNGTKVGVSVVKTKSVEPEQ